MISPEIAARINSDLGSDSWYTLESCKLQNGVISYQLGQHENMFIGGATRPLASTVTLASQSRSICSLCDSCKFKIGDVLSIEVLPESQFSRTIAA
jgi:hypothetical protein